MEVLGGLELGRVGDVEEAEAYSRLEEDLDHVGRVGCAGATLDEGWCCGCDG